MTEIDFAYFTSERVLSAYAQCLFPPGTGSRAGVGEHTASRRRLRLHGGQAMRTEAGDSAHDSEKDRGIQRGAGPVTRRLAAWLAVAVLAGAALAVLGGGCSHPAGLLAPDGPPARPHCGGAPVLALGALQVQRAYGVPAMLAAGINGTGTVIADILPYQNPWVAQDLAAYSRRYGLPPARVRIISYGHPPVATHNGEGRAVGPGRDRRCGDDARTRARRHPGLCRGPRYGRGGAV